MARPSIAFKELWFYKDLSDVTLATEDNGQIDDHKVILAAGSPFFVSKRLSPALSVRGVPPPLF